MTTSMFVAAIACFTVPNYYPIERAVSPTMARQSVERSLEFITSDNAVWKEKAHCSTCHHGAISITAFCEARARGFDVADQTIAETLDWTKGRFVPAYEDKPKLTDGFNIPSMAMPLLVLSLSTKPDAVKAGELDRMVKYIIDRQETDGGWPIPEKNAHPVFESREVMTIWFYLVLETAAHHDSKFAAAVRSSRDKALEWIKTTQPADSTQASALRLMVSLRSTTSEGIIKKQVEALLHRQKADGGWSQVKELGSDAYATGQALYALNLAGVKNSRKEIQRGVAFLVSTQREDGSWAMASRHNPGRPPAKNLSPIIHFGTAWATMGLVRSIPKVAAE